MSEAPRLVLLHLQKTGGTTLHRQFAAGFPAAAICPERFDRLHKFGPGLGEFAYYSGHFNFDALDYIPGPKRVVTVLREPRERLVSLYMFWTRHSDAWVAANPGAAPALARQCPDFTSFLTSAERLLRDGTQNEMARRLAGWCDVGAPGEYTYRGEPMAPEAVLARAEANLRRIDFVGVTEVLDGLYARVAVAHGLPAAAALPRVNTRDDRRPEFMPAREAVLTAEAEVALERLTWMDQRLYALAREMAG